MSHSLIWFLRAIALFYIKMFIQHNKTRKFFLHAACEGYASDQGISNHYGI